MDPKPHSVCLLRFSAAAQVRTCWPSVLCPPSPMSGLYLRTVFPIIYLTFLFRTNLFLLKKKKKKLKGVYSKRNFFFFFPLMETEI